MFINDALAAAEAPQVGSLGVQIIQIALILLIFYWLLIRPQQKRIRAHAEMVNALKIGDKVVTTSGIYGQVIKLDETTATIEIAQNVNITIERMSIGNVLAAENKKSSHANSAGAKTAKASKTAATKK